MHTVIKFGYLKFDKQSQSRATKGIRAEGGRVSWEIPFFRSWNTSPTRFQAESDSNGMYNSNLYVAEFVDAAVLVNKEQRSRAETESFS